MIRHLVAIDQKRGMAKDGKQPWHLPTDEQYFLRETQTLGGVVVMGRKTYEVIGHPLRERRNIVLSDKPEEIEGVEVFTDLREALHAAEDVWVIGGASIFKQTMNAADELYITRIDSNFDCELFYPEFEQDFVLASRSEPQHENGLNFRFEVWKRRVPKA